MTSSLNNAPPTCPAGGDTAIVDSFDTILILDFGSQLSHLITRRLRELHVYCEMLPCTQKMATLSWKPKGIILSGSPYSVYDTGAPHVDPAVFDYGVPVLGICYGLQETARHHGAKVEACDKREYGHAVITVQKHGQGGVEADGHIDQLFAGITGDMQVWMSHSDRLFSLPAGFKVVAFTESAPFAALAHESKPIYGVQFHPEVTHSPRGKEIFDRFATICGVRRNWRMDAFVETEIARIRKLVGPKAQVIGAVSGGVDSSVAARLMHEAIGDRFHAIMVDNGVLRKNEADQVNTMLNEHLGVNLTVVDASETFLNKLRDVEDPEQKRKIIGNTFIEVFEEEAARIEAAAEKAAETKGDVGQVEFLLQGTLYPDVIESVSFKGPSATIKTHHNTALPDTLKLKLIEPLRELFKGASHSPRGRLTILTMLTDEASGLDRKRWAQNIEDLAGPGLAIRILGAVTAERVRMVQDADAIFIEEIRANGLYDDISQAYAALVPVRTVGVQGDARTYHFAICLRAVTTVDFMTADWYAFDSKILRRISTRIVNEVAGVNRVWYDCNSKPPATIEML